MLEAFDADPSYNEVMERIVGLALNQGDVEEDDIDDLSAYQRLTGTE